MHELRRGATPTTYKAVATEAMRASARRTRASYLALARSGIYVPPALVAKLRSDEKSGEPPRQEFACRHIAAGTLTLCLMNVRHLSPGRPIVGRRNCSHRANCGSDAGRWTGLGRTQDLTEYIGVHQNSIADGSGLIEVSVARATSTEDLGLQFNRISGQLGIDSQAIQVSRQLHG
jgi:hypothetical protein